MIAEKQGGLIVNADALQVYDGWQIITARPGPEDLKRAPHFLYGHIAHDRPYSVGNWLREVAALLHQRLIIVGGTGLYFTALTEGLAEIPQTPMDVRRQADKMSLEELSQGVDGNTLRKIDNANRVRVQRAWEVQATTGKSLLDWQDETPPALLPLPETIPILLNANKEWLTPRIEMRFDQMLEMGALEEARGMIPKWNAADPSAKAIGAQELIAHIKGELSLEEAREAAIIATRQYAKRQRTWFRKRMSTWNRFDLSSTDLSTAITL